MITLGIIGVVAAMTMPILIGNYQKKVVVEELKKYYSELQNALYISVAEHGDSTDWNYPQNSDITLEQFMNEYFLPYLKLKKYKIKKNTYDVTNYNGGVSKIIESYLTYNWNGACLFIRSNQQYLMFTMDLNCEKLPNKVGRDIFDLGELYWLGPRKLKIMPNSVTWDEQGRQSIISSCKSFKFLGGAPNYCFAIIINDGWSMLKDYPW